MTNHPKGSLNTVLFGIVIALASVAFVITIPQIVLASHDDTLTLPSSAELDLEEAEAATMAGTTNQTTTNGNTTEFLSIQRAQSGSLSEINATAYTLELKNISDSTLLFSDRPERIEETISTTDFVGNWTAGPNSFESDEPNDALMVGKSHE